MRKDQTQLTDHIGKYDFVYLYIACHDVSLVNVYTSDCLRRQLTVKRLKKTL